MLFYRSRLYKFFIKNKRKFKIDKRKKKLSMRKLNKIFYVCHRIVYTPIKIFQSRLLFRVWMASRKEICSNVKLGRWEGIAEGIINIIIILRILNDVIVYIILIGFPSTKLLGYLVSNTVSELISNHCNSETIIKLCRTIKWACVTIRIGEGRQKKRVLRVRKHNKIQYKNYTYWTSS